MLPLKILYNKHSEFCEKLLVKLLKVFKLFKRKDFINENIDVSIDRFLFIKNKYSRVNDFYEKIAACDAVVINGEGSIIFKTPQDRIALFLLFVLKLSQKLNKKTYLLNTMLSFSPNSNIDKKFQKQLVEVLEQCNGIGFRDKYSIQVLKNLSPDSKFRYNFIPDALFTWRNKFEQTYIADYKNGSFDPQINSDLANKNFDFNGDYICVSGSSALSSPKKRENAISSYVKLLVELKKLNIPILLVPGCKGDMFLYDVAKKMNISIIPLEINVKIGGGILSNARVFISGRFHPSILASLGGTPCVFFDSNSHKTLSIQEILEYPTPHSEFSSEPSDLEIRDICNSVKYFLANNNEIRERVKTIVDKLSKESYEKNIEMINNN
jgi:polysaccharide pyruvyl transferase WcaK-like protein